MLSLCDCAYLPIYTLMNIINQSWIRTTVSKCLGRQEFCDSQPLFHYSREFHRFVCTKGENISIPDWTFWPDQHSIFFQVNHGILMKQTKEAHIHLTISFYTVEKCYCLQMVSIHKPLQIKWRHNSKYQLEVHDIFCLQSSQELHSRVNHMLSSKVHLLYKYCSSQNQLFLNNFSNLSINFMV